MTAATRRVGFVVPRGVDAPERVSGGNVYDRRVRDGLVAAGWDVRMVEAADALGVAAALAAMPDDGLVIVDGLVAGWAPVAVAVASARLRLLLLAHTAGGADRQVLGGVRRVIATSSWTAGELIRSGLHASRVGVALPGSDPAPASPASADGSRLLCVGVVAPHKGQDLLLDALERVDARAAEWSCTLAGSTDADPAYATVIATRAAGIGPRIRLAGVLTGAALDRAYRNADVLVAPSRSESFGMAIADARSRGLPVIAAAVGGIPEAVAPAGALLVPPDDAAALAEALQRWLTDPALRAHLRAGARRERAATPRWPGTVARVAAFLEAA